MPPTYDYVCQSCNHEFNCIQKITDDPIAICPECGLNRAKRLISVATTFILKGSGWYSDGYGSGSSKKSEE